VEHCELEHETLLSIATLAIDMPAPEDSSEARDADFVLEGALLLASFGPSGVRGVDEIDSNSTVRRKTQTA
jgi:hypothetical protein